MKRTRVQIDKLIIRNSNLSRPDAVALRGVVEANLGQLLTQGAVSAESHTTNNVKLNAGPQHSFHHVAKTTAHALFRTIRGKI